MKGDRPLVHDMNYQYHYNKLMHTRLHLQAERLEERRCGAYYERHHIVPKSHGGSNAKENLILLTAREHFLAHWMLWRIHRTRQMAHAFFCMSRDSGGRRLTGAQRDILGKMRVGAYSGANSPRGFKGKNHTPEAKRRMSVSKVGPNNPMSGLGAAHPNYKRTGKNNPNYALDPWKNPAVLRKPAAVWLWDQRDQLFHCWVEMGCPHWYTFGKWACANVGETYQYIPHNFAVMVKWFGKIHNGIV